MAYPERSDWTSGVPLSAWYAENVTGRAVRACQTSGWAFLRDLQETLKTRLSQAPKPTVGGATVDGSGILINDLSAGTDQGWNAPLLQALYAVAQADRAPSGYLQAVLQDLSSGHVSIPTLQTALWVTYLNEGQNAQGDTVYGQGSPTEAMVRQDSVLPAWLVPPSRPPNGVVSSGLSCFAAPDALTAVPSAGWKAFIGNPWVILGLATLGVAGIMVAMQNIPRSRPQTRKGTS